MELTDRQRQILEYVNAHVDRHGYPPTVREIGEAVGLTSPSTVHAHLAKLESAGLIRREVRGRTHWCRLDPGPLASAREWLAYYDRFWTGRLNVLERLLRQEDASNSHDAKGESQ